MEGTAHHKEHGMLFDITLDITLDKETIKEVTITSNGITIKKTVKEALTNYLKGKTINQAKKITDNAMISQLATDQPLALTINHALQNALRDHEQKKEGDTFAQAYDAIKAYQEGYTAPSQQEFSECSTCHHHESTPKH
ncbi:MAG TPA: iron-sulfur cluster assembly scaffold protein [Candidatus Nanoarchaeia archaeon]|nr:iron-sulfur cluster assembly scaffold protein [Candidatus Nanoarchaeia archaeon]